MKAISHHTALIYTMVIVSAADGSMSEKELKIIGELTKVLPSFQGFDHSRLLAVCQECAQILQEPDGADAVMGLIDEGLPDVLHETAYWVALEVALADRRIALEEVRMLDALRRRLEIDKLTAAAIERGARAKYQVA
ncbi:MAG: tellurite resistance TerB family protein [Alphaproteobacteria bacterium]|nr:tellurite resistance TerB family protein [Alphaproteobacteria bacterium]MBV9418866.1 tellurite resistance TerB family protein [Alphaproteobacteria bacterium]MBV9541843.1 tellurite resistance TerB family protein [Alphaproteobacteria bacterium]MBV9905079.1 tellurite resistance TerB family protein [Alphaproteobacteria bacterium]